MVRRRHTQPGMMGSAAPFDPHGQGRASGAGREQREGGGGEPAPGHSALDERGQQQSAAGEDGEGARPVDAGPGRPPPFRFVQMADDQGEGECPDRQVDEEDPAPVGVPGEHSAERGARDRGQGPDGGEPGLDPGAFLERVEVGGDHLDGALECPAAQPLDDAEGDEGGHVPGSGAQQRSDEEHDGARHQDGLAAEGVGELPVDREGDGDGEQIAGEQPGEDGEAAEIADDLRNGGRDDGGVERGQRHGEHQRGDDGAASAGRGGGCPTGRGVLTGRGALGERGYGVPRRVPLRCRPPWRAPSAGPRRLWCPILVRPTIPCRLRAGEERIRAVEAADLSLPLREGAESTPSCAPPQGLLP